MTWSTTLNTTYSKSETAMKTNFNFFCRVWHAEWLMKNYKWCTSRVCVCKEPFWHQDRCAFLWEWLITMIETLNYTTFFWGKMLFNNYDIQQQWAMRNYVSTLFNLRPEAFLEPQTTGCEASTTAIHVCGWVCSCFLQSQRAGSWHYGNGGNFAPMAFAFAILFVMMVKISSKGYMLLMLKQAKVWNIMS